MRILLIFIFVAALLILFFSIGGLNNLSESITGKDLNPKLISYLQGTWVMDKDKKLAIQIKRDSIFDIENNSIKKSSQLYYSFNSSAADYFTNDSSFKLKTSDFKLIKIDSMSKDTIVYILSYVSKTRLDISINNNILKYSKDF